ncbi:MAG: HD domain-containing protein [Spirochaetales bacterium]|nr:HD domain-containing protein [Spirochaetales bacterium]
MRGIESPESVGEHIFSTVVLAVLIIDQLKEAGISVDKAKLLKMAALHESGEILTGDIPAPATALFGKDEKSRVEREAAKKVLKGFPGLFTLVQEFEDGESPEAKIVKSIDKIQMMIKVMLYESEGRGAMEDFWAWEHNFVHCGIGPVDELVDAVRSSRGHEGAQVLKVMTEDGIPKPR